MTYSTSSTPTAYSVAVSAAGVQSVAWGFDISNGLTCTLAATNATSSTWTDTFHSPSGATTSKSFGSRTFTWSRGHGDAAKTVKVTMTNASGYADGTSSKSISVTVPALPSYTVTFNANGGTGGPGSQTKWHGEDLTLTSSKPTRTGYTFVRWNTAADGSGTNYSSGGTYTANASTTLYAQWSANTYAVSYSANGGTGGPTSQTKTYGVNLTITSYQPTRTGYTFGSWNTKADGSGTTYSSGGTYTANAAVTLYAQWNVDTYTITFNDNGGAGGPGTRTKTYGVALTIPSTTPTRTNYEFLGWGTSSGSTTPSYAPGGSYTANAAATLWAVWRLAYWSPAITDLTAIRCDSGGVADDEGTYALVSFDWAVCTTVANAVDTVTIERKLGGSWTNLATVSASGTSGTVSEIVDNNGNLFSVNTTYTLRVVVTDTYGGTSIAQTILSQAFFTLDFMSGGHGVGIGAPATEADTIRVGMDIHALADVVADNGVTAAGDVIGLNIGGAAYATDLDDLVTPGVYYCTTASTNGPVASTAGQCVVGANASRANVVQLFTTYGNAPATYVRRLSSGTWSGWQMIGDTVAEDNPTLSNAAATTFAVRRKSGVATIYVRELAVTTALASGSAVSIATLPSGYRPTYTTGIPLTSTTVNAARGVFLYVTSGGAVSIYNRSGNSLTTSSNLYGTGTYVL